MKRSQKNNVPICEGVGGNAGKEATDVWNVLGVEMGSEAEKEGSCEVTHCERNNRHIDMNYEKLKYVKIG